MQNVKANRTFTVCTYQDLVLELTRWDDHTEAADVCCTGRIAELQAEPQILLNTGSRPILHYTDRGSWSR